MRTGSCITLNTEGELGGIGDTPKWITQVYSIFKSSCLSMNYNKHREQQSWTCDPNFSTSGDGITLGIGGWGRTAMLYPTSVWRTGEENAEEDWDEKGRMFQRVRGCFAAVSVKIVMGTAFAPSTKETEKPWEMNGLKSSSMPSLLSHSEWRRLRFQWEHWAFAHVISEWDRQQWGGLAHDNRNIFCFSGSAASAAGLWRSKLSELFSFPIG